jgi:hypothetical protein
MCPARQAFTGVFLKMLAQKQISDIGRVLQHGRDEK